MGRPLFRRRPQRSAMIGLASIFIAHYANKLLPETATARILAEMAVALVSLTALTLFVLAHHNRTGHVRIMNQTQEEVLLIGVFGLFWFAFLIGLRAWNERHILEGMDHGHAQSYTHSRPIASPSEPMWGATSVPVMDRPYLSGCHGGTFMCVKEGISKSKW